MFKKLFSFGRKKPNAKETPAANTVRHTSQEFAPNTKIPYKPNLIATLTNEHKALVALHSKIISLIEEGDTKSARVLLGKFKDLFMGHVIKENTSLYTYLKHTIEDDATNEVVSSMKSEMDSIGKDVNAFLRLYKAESVPLDEEFIKKFESIGGALVRRIKNEERHLYPTYQPINNYSQY